MPGGVGLSERLWARHDELVAGAAELLAACTCDAGCPACTGPRLGRHRRQGTRAAAPRGARGGRRGGRGMTASVPPGQRLANFRASLGRGDGGGSIAPARAPTSRGDDRARGAARGRPRCGARAASARHGGRPGGAGRRHPAGSGAARAPARPAGSDGAVAGPRHGGPRASPRPPGPLPSSWVSAGGKSDRFRQQRAPAAPDHADEPAMLDLLGERIPARRWLVTYNGRGFDWPLLVARYRLECRARPGTRRTPGPGTGPARLATGWTMPGCPPSRRSCSTSSATGTSAGGKSGHLSRRPPQRQPRGAARGGRPHA